MRIPNNLRRIRRSTVIGDHTLTLMELGEKTGIDYRHLCGYEQGRSVPTDDQLLKICEVFGVDPSAVYPQAVVQVLASDSSEGLQPAMRDN